VQQWPCALRSYNAPRIDRHQRVIGSTPAPRATMLRPWRTRTSPPSLVSRSHAQSCAPRSVCRVVRATQRRPSRRSTTKSPVSCVAGRRRATRRLPAVTAGAGVAGAGELAAVRAGARRVAARRVLRALADVLPRATAAAAVVRAAANPDVGAARVGEDAPVGSEGGGEVRHEMTLAPPKRPREFFAVVPRIVDGQLRIRRPPTPALRSRHVQRLRLRHHPRS
jgi:hypothetical protein